MLQRIQTLFLLAVSVISLTLFFVPFMQYEQAATNTALTLMPGFSAEGINKLLLIPMLLNLVILLFSLVIIFSYKKRIRQMKLAQLLMALSGIMMGLMLLLEYKTGTAAIAKSYLAGSYLPIGSMLFSFLASRFIKKDEDLVRSADRIR